MALAGAASLVMHSAAVLVMMPHEPEAGYAPATPPSFEVEMVDQAAAVQGASAAPSAEPVPPPAPDMPSDPDPGPTSDPLPPKAAPETRAPRPEPQVNLSGGDEDRNPMFVTGDHVVPARPDGRMQNKAPAYPPDAARRGSQGLVGLVIHIMATGAPAWVDIRVSSGDPVLDNAARDAVSAWRFQPAHEGGMAVPFDYAYSISFSLNGHGRSVSHGTDRPGYDPRR